MSDRKVVSLARDDTSGPTRLLERPRLTPIHQAALTYVTDYRLLLIPLNPGEKRPAYKTGPDHATLATLNTERINEWWTHKDFNIGLPCTPNRLAVIDVDGPEGETHLHQLETQHGHLPTTWMQTSARTDRPSIQYVYRWPNDQIVPTTRISEQLEVRAHGAQIVVAPSLHPTGSTYQWLIPPSDMPGGPAELPAWVLAELTRPAQTPQDPPHRILSNSVGTSLAEKRFDGLVAMVANAPEGDRNILLNHAAYTAARIPGLTDHQIIDRLTIAAETVGLEPREIVATINSGIAAGHADGPDPDHAEPAWTLLIPQAPGPDPHTLEDLDAFLNSPDPEYDWVIEGLIERGDRIILTGTEGAGKTTLLRQIAVTAAAGIHPFTAEPIPPQTVLYIDLENSTRHSRRQFRPLRLAAGDQLNTDRMYPIIRPDGLDLLTPEDQTWLQEVIEQTRPDILILGPVYKLVGGDPTEEQPAKHASMLLDRLRTNYGFSLLMEAHSPHEAQGRKRPKRPYGASLWLRWPEFGLHISDQGAFTHWRGPRDERAWPGLLKRGGPWPWTLAVSPSDQTWQKILAYCETQLLRPGRRLLASAIEVPKTTLDRAIQAHADEWAALFEEAE